MERIPQTIMDLLDDYVMYGKPPGALVTAILLNDLTGTFYLASDDIIKQLPLIVSHIQTNIPPICWGTLAKVKAWTEILSIIKPQPSNQISLDLPLKLTKTKPERKEVK